MPIEIIDREGTSQSRYFVEKLKDKLSKRDFIIVTHGASLKMEVMDFHIHTYSRTVTVKDDCSGGHRSFTLEDEELDGHALLTEDGIAIGQWSVEASNYDVLKEQDPILLQILFPDDEEEDCYDYRVKSKERMRANLRACARRIAAAATKRVNRLN